MDEESEIFIVQILYYLLKDPSKDMNLWHSCALANNALEARESFRLAQLDIGAYCKAEC